MRILSQDHSVARKQSIMILKRFLPLEIYRTFVFHGLGSTDLLAAYAIQLILTSQDLDNYQYIIPEMLRMFPTTGETLDFEEKYRSGNVSICLNSDGVIKTTILNPYGNQNPRIKIITVASSVYLVCNEVE